MAINKHPTNCNFNAKIKVEVVFDYTYFEIYGNAEDFSNT